MRCRARFRCCTLIVAVLWVLAARVEAQTARIGGLVRDEDARPLKGATVVAESAASGVSLTATTDDKGRFTIIGLRPGIWRVVAQAPGHAPQGGDMSVRASVSLNPPVTFALRRTAPPPSAVLGGLNAKEVQTALLAADSLFNQQKWEEAATAYRSLLTKAPGLSVLNLQIAAALRNRQEYDAAIGAYQELLKLDPSSQKAVIGISQTQMEKGDAAAAEETLTRRAAERGDGKHVFFALAELKAGRGQTEEADRWYQRAADADPAWGKPRYKLGMSALARGDNQSAARLMSQVVRVDPVSPEATEAKTVLEQLRK